MSDKLKSFLPHAIIVLGLLVLAVIYAKPILNNKVLYQYDIVQAQGAAKEIQDYEKKTGEYSLWTNSMFGGMPSYTIMGKYPFSFTSNLSSTLTYLIPQPANFIFYLLLGGYVMLAVLGFNPLLSLLGAIAFGFSSYHLISLEAGHVSKVLAIAFAPPLLAGTILLYRGKYLKGGIVTAIFVFLELYSNHVQISYYLFIALFLYVIYEFFVSLRTNELKQFFTASGILVVIALLGVGSMASKFWTTYEYTKSTMRGGSELKSSPQKGGGLDKDYAFSWSYGKAETFTFLIPDFYGGASQGSLDKDSETYGVIKKLAGAESAKSFVSHLPLYWGSQPNTGGPAYLGAIICFLFILSLFVVKNPLKWWALTVVILFTMLSWGKNFYPLTNLFFDYVPMYNKFRAVTMIHSLVAMVMVFMAVWGVKAVVDRMKEEQDVVLNSIKWVTVGFAGLLLFFVLFGSSVFSFEKLPEGDKESSGDEYFVKNLEQMTKSKEIAEEIYSAILEDRASLFRADSVRSLVFILLTAALLWFYVKGKYKEVVVYAVLVVLALFDIWAVDKRYLNNDDFIPKKKYQATFEPSLVDQQILQDPDPDYRVMNTTVSTFNDASTSIFHKSIGGYSAAKIQRYQDLIEHHISTGNMNVLNMLNTKYFIQQAGEGQSVATRNPGALGHAWFVNNVKWVKDADAELNALKDFNPAKEVVIDEKFKSAVGNFSSNVDSSASIKLIKYAPNQLEYESNSGETQLAVFSEIYYDNSLGWKAYIDGKEVPHFRVNYVLRGMTIPAGKHKIEFKFYPQAYYTGEKIALVCSLLLFGLIIGLAVMKVKNDKDEELTL